MTIRIRQVLQKPNPDNKSFSLQFIRWLGGDDRWGLTKKGGAWSFNTEGEKSSFKLELIK